jgi:hypothetical protein
MEKDAVSGGTDKMRFDSLSRSRQNFLRKNRREKESGHARSGDPEEVTSTEHRTTEDGGICRAQRFANFTRMIRLKMFIHID